MNQPMRIAIVGGGAMGTIFGCGLHEAGIDTTVLEVSTDLVELVRERGVVIEDAAGERTVRMPITSAPEEVGAVDVVFFFVKCYHTRAAADLAAPLVGPATTIVSLQNGWGNGDVLSDRYPDNPLVVGVTYSSGSVRAPGRIAFTNAAQTLLGPFEPRHLDAARTVGELVARGGFETRLVEGIKSEIWRKLVLNTATLATSALTGSTAAALDDTAEMRALIDAIARETTAIGRAAGFDVDPEERIATIHEILLGAGTGKASMLQDVEASRRTEVDVVNGAAIRMAASVGLEAPLNGALFALVKTYEQAHGLA